MFYKIFQHCWCKAYPKLRGWFQNKEYLRYVLLALPSVLLTAQGFQTACESKESIFGIFKKWRSSIKIASLFCGFLLSNSILKLFKIMTPDTLSVPLPESLKLLLIWGFIVSVMWILLFISAILRWSIARTWIYFQRLLGVQNTRTANFSYFMTITASTSIWAVLLFYGLIYITQAQMTGETYLITQFQEQYPTTIIILAITVSLIMWRQSRIHAVSASYLHGGQNHAIVKSLVMISVLCTIMWLVPHVMLSE